MKHRIAYIVAFVTLVIAGCQKHNPETHPQGSIRFAIDKVETKSNDDVFETVDQIKGKYIRLWGFRYTTKPNGDLNKSDSFMADYQGIICKGGEDKWNTVYYNQSTNSWSENLYYWTPGASHRFYAIFPTYAVGGSSPLVYTVDEKKQTVHMPQVTAGTLLKDGNYTNNCQDILYGIKNIPEQFQIQDFPDKVQLTMKHACAALVFRIKNLTGSSVDRILPTGEDGWDMMYIKGVKYKGTMDLDPSGITWTLKDDVTTNQLYIKPLNQETTIANGATSVNTFTAIVLPQNFGSSSMPHKFRVFNESSDTEIKYEVDIAKIGIMHDGKLTYEWKPGYRYIYTMDVTDTHIICSVSVVPWIEDEAIIL